MPIFPELADALKTIRSGFGSDLVTLDLKSITSYAFSTTTVPEAEWYQRNGYYGISNYLSRTVNGDQALSVPAFYAGVKIISEDMGAMPFKTYERSADRSETNLAYSHPLFPTLKNLVNPDISSGEFVEALTAHALMVGGGLAEIQRVGGSIFLYPWKPGEWRRVSDSRGSSYYVRKEGGGPEKTYVRSKVFHLRGFTLNGVDGDDLIVRARSTIGLSTYIENFARSFFESDGIPGVVITRPLESGNVTPEGVAVFKQKYREERQKPHSMLYLQESMDAKTLKSTAADSQLVEQGRAQVLQVCRLLRIPPHKLAELTGAIKANIEQEAIEYYTNCLNPWIERWKRAVHRCLLTTDEQAADRIYAEHDVSAMLRGDFAAQSEGWRKLMEKGVLSINQVLRMLNMNPVDGGDVHLVQMNMAPIAAVAAGLTLQKVGAAVPAAAGA